MPEEPDARPEETPAPDPADGVDAPTNEPAPDPGDLPAEESEPITRLVLVVLGIAVLGLVTWWFSPPEESPAPGPAEDAPPEQPEVAPRIVISVFGGVDDRYFVEPCARIPGGGLNAMRATVDLVREETYPDHLGISMGDLSVVPGRPGIGALEALLTSVLPEAGVDVMAAGLGELQHGVGYARGMLAEVAGCAILCANALDAEGYPVLRGWAVTTSGGHNVLTVAVAGESLGYGLVARGSDVRIGAPAEHARKALDEGLRRAEDIESPAMTKVLLVQGTVDEAAELARAVPGFDVVVAGRGGILPTLDPLKVRESLVLYAGRGMRFTWQLGAGGGEEGVRHRLQRIGDRATSRGSPYEEPLYGIGGRLMMIGFPLLAEDDVRMPDPRGDYVGSASCMGCHPDEVVMHGLSPHASVTDRVLRGRFAGSPACLPCHVTAPFRRGGWLPGDEEGLAGVSCEACHGPASGHVVEPGPGYGALDFATCYRCHLPDRSPGLDAEASWEASGHGAPRPPPDEEDDDEDDGEDPADDGDEPR